MCMLYNSILALHFDYGDNIWGTCNVSPLQKIRRLQNRAAKIITDSARMDSSTETLIANELNWLNIKERYQFHPDLNMFKVMVKHPYYLANRFNISKMQVTLRGYKNYPSPNQEQSLKKDLFHTVVRHCGIPYQMQLQVRAIFCNSRRNIPVNLSDCHPTFFSVYIT